MEDHVSNLNDRNKTRIITCMKLAYFFGKQDIALTKYEALCDLAYALDVKDMPLRKDYSSYTNLMAGKDFITSISNYLEVEQKSLVHKSPFYALMLDESTDRALEKHLILYISFLDKEGYGVCNVQFLKLILVQDGYAQTKIDAIMNMISHMHLDLRKLVGISTDGDSSMLGCRDGLVAKLSRHVPHLISVHCVAHREALAIIDACKSFPCLSYIDKIANKIYSWISASTVRHTDFQKLLEEMNIQILEVLQICDVRWLARGNIMVRLIKLLPAILTFWQENAHAWYEKLRVFNLLFAIHMLADVLYELDGLNKIFQKENIDVTSFSTSIEVALQALKKKFLIEPFGRNTLHLQSFMEKTSMGYLEHKNENGDEYKHFLLYSSIPGKDKNDIPFDTLDGDLDSCIEMAKSFVQKVIDAINQRFSDIYFFNACKLFSPMHYPNDEIDREKKGILWLSRLLTRMDKHVIDVHGCENEVKVFMDIMYYGCEGMNIKDAWRVFSNTSHWHDKFHMLPISSVPCERGFSKQNLIKTDRRQSLNLKTLEMLMRISILGPSYSLVDWERIYAIWQEAKHRRPSDL
ncbi:hypothetical protein KP509_33G052100 [Ceratopteris richardii]|uniref:Uncharacterized protein n=1 Tax=Ceratopteris richardii TaxID=49495 RepID=A0A8T2QP24_CERRI|nr:hypothetical protein KP509_33G052100 [Ceratopteris richardii]